MAVFTAITKEELAAWLQDYTLGTLVQMRGIAAGIENSNFFLTFNSPEEQANSLTLSSDEGGLTPTHVLTIFERLTEQELPFYLEFMLHLSQHGVLVPRPILCNEGRLFNMLCNKPAAIATKLEGQVQLNPTPDHCAQVGAMLAQMHEAGRSFVLRQPNLRSLDWWIETIPLLKPFLSASQNALLDEELHFQKNFFASEHYAALGRGPCHCDLFRDNVLFTPGPQNNLQTSAGEFAAPIPAQESRGDTLSGFLDFYFAGDDTWLFDLSVCVNDWCIDLESGELDWPRLQALVQGYQSVRPLSALEIEHFGAALRAAALRFWISRLYDFYMPREAALLAAHDPDHFERILRLRRDKKRLQDLQTNLRR